MFLRRSSTTRDPLPVAMCDVRMGGRVLQVGVDDPRLAGALAAKVGLSGHAAFVVNDERTAEKARAAAAKAGALVDVEISRLDSLRFPEESFDLVVINGMGGLLAALEPDVREKVLRECHRVLRAGGRLVIVEPGTRSGLGALLHRDSKRGSEYETNGGAETALRAANFAAVRLLGDKEGYRFTEGLRGRT